MKQTSFTWWLPMLCLLTSCRGPDGAPEAIVVLAHRQDVVAELTRVIRHEMREKSLPSVSIAIVEEGALLFSEAFGEADPAQGAAATRDTVYRVGSISKLFTGVAVMQLVEEGKLDLDVPIARYLPGFRGPNATLRQILSHRSGLVREPPVGSYFDPAEPTLEACARSLYELAGVYPPGTRTKYSNAAVTLAGHIVALVGGEPYEARVRRTILDRCGMRSSWRASDAGSRLAKARMWSYDGRDFEAPVFELGTTPAGNLYGTMDDLARFALELFACQKGRGTLLSQRSLEQMWQPSASGDGAYGVSFRLGKIDGERTVGHGGAVYGFATQLTLLPDHGVAVAVSASTDVANTTVGRIADHAVRCLLRARAGSALIPLPLSRALETSDVAKFLPFTPSDDVIHSSGRVFVRSGDLIAEVRRDDQGFVVDDRHALGPRVTFEGGELRIGKRGLAPMRPPCPPPPPTAWQPLFGEYGWDHNVLFVYERKGRLQALVEWVFEYPMEPTSDPLVWSFPDRGLYHGEQIRFVMDRGLVQEAVMASVRFPRRPGGNSHDTFRIQPLKPIPELRALALAARPPVEPQPKSAPDLVELGTLDPSLRYDIRYATTNNFMGAPFYRSARAFLQRPAAEALLAAHRSLASKGFGLLIFDAYRPWFVTKMFYDATPESMRHFVADPSLGSRHNRGSAVDLTLFDLTTGRPVEMVSGYDEFTERAYPHYQGGTSRQRWHRDLLRDTMEAAGFDVYQFEWWHFDFKDWRNYPIMTPTFEEIRVRPR